MSEQITFEEVVPLTREQWIALCSLGSKLSLEAMFGGQFGAFGEWLQLRGDPNKPRQFSDDDLNAILVEISADEDCATECAQEIAEVKAAFNLVE